MSDTDRFIRMFRELMRVNNKPFSKTDALIQKLLDAYSAPARHYHGVKHIDSLLRHYNDHARHIKDGAAFILAIYFHDYVYEISREKPEISNEQKSADAAEAELLEMGFRPEFISRVKEFIVATQKHKDSGDPDINLFLDMDLSILAANPKDYDEYTRNIFKEYLAVFTLEERKAGRAAFLEDMLKRPNIFLTERFQQFEPQARANMTRELENLKMEREPITGVYAGSYDPITRGHMGIICAALLKLDVLVVGLGINPKKVNSRLFSFDEGKILTEKAIEDFINEVESNPDASSVEKKAVQRIRSGAVKIIVENYEGMTVDFCVKHKAQQLIRGMRPIGDFDNEMSYANAYTVYAEAIDYPLTITIIPTPDPKYMFASSSIIRDMAHMPKAINKFLYPSTAEAVAEKVREREERASQTTWQEKTGTGR